MIDRALRTHFRPEFLNRLDEVVIFRPLGEKEIAAIVDLQVAQVGARLADRRITLKVTEAAKKLLAAEGFDPTFGARPLKRTVQRRVVDPLTTRLLAGEVPDGSVVEVGAKGGEVVLSIRTGSKGS